jgi:hypothetical protein
MWQEYLARSGHTPDANPGGNDADRLPHDHVVGVKSVNDPNYRVNQHGLVWAGLAVRFGAECLVVGGGAQIRRAPKPTRNATASP